MQGQVTSYAGVQLERYASWTSHPPEEGAVQQILFNEFGVATLASRSVHFMKRGGWPLWHTAHPDMKDLKCMVFIDKEAFLLAAGNQSKMLKIRSNDGGVIEELQSTSNYAMFKAAGRYICAATSTGTVDFLDLNTLQVVKTWQAHTASISDMEVSGSSLVTCGRALKEYAPAMLDNLAKVYDLKGMQQMAPIPFPTGAAYVQIHPKLTTTIILAAPSGQIQVIDLINHNTSHLTYAGVAILHIIMSSSGNIWAIADEHNQLHLWGDLNKALNFNDHVVLPEYADNVEHQPFIGIDDDV